MKLTNLKTNYIGREFIYYKKIDSTQSEIYRLVEENKIKNGMTIFSEIQTNGKGTHGRIWHTDEENNIAFSMYIDLNLSVDKLDGLTLKIAQILVSIFKDIYDINIDIKLPNDLMINGKKIGGILTETKMVSDKIKYMVLGIGINTSKKIFDGDIKNIASSISNEYNITIDNEKIVTEFCNRFEEEIEKRRI